MIGKYLDNQVTNLKKGVFAAATLFGIGFIIYKAITKRKAIAAALGIGKGKVSSEDIKNLQGESVVAIPQGDEEVQEGEVIDVDAIDDNTENNDDDDSDTGDDDADNSSSSES